MLSFFRKGENAAMLSRCHLERTTVCKRSHACKRVCPFGNSPRKIGDGSRLCSASAVPGGF